MQLSPKSQPPQVAYIIVDLALPVVLALPIARRRWLLLGVARRRWLLLGAAGCCSDLSRRPPLFAIGNPLVDP